MRLKNQSDTAGSTPGEPAEPPLSFKTYLEDLEESAPSELVHVTEVVDPADFGVTAVLQRLEDKDLYPLVVFDRPLNLHGEVSEFPLVSNIYAGRERCAAALGLQRSEAYLELGLEFARREQTSLEPVRVPPSESPVKDQVSTGEQVDLRKFPIVRHHRMDGGPYIDMTICMRDPDSGSYNAAFLRTQYRGPDSLRIHMSPQHSLQITRKNEREGRPTPVVIVVSHHPAFHIGSLNVGPFGVDDYGVIGSISGRPLRVTPSETWGDDFLVPADADIVIEGEIPPGVMEVEGPFGEFPGTYGAQGLKRIIEVKAVTHRNGAIYQDIFVGHRDNWVLGAFPKEGSIYNQIKGIVPSVKAVYLPESGVGRFHCYVSIDKQSDGEGKRAALIALSLVDTVKHVIVVDADVDVYREEEVLWALATRFQADEDLDVIRNIKSTPLDPSLIEDVLGAKMILDATMPLNRPFEARNDIPEDRLQAVDLAKLIPADQLARLR